MRARARDAASHLTHQAYGFVGHGYGDGLTGQGKGASQSQMRAAQSSERAPGNTPASNLAGLSAALNGFPR